MALQAGGGSALDLGVNGEPREVREQDPPPPATLPSSAVLYGVSKDCPGNYFNSAGEERGLGRAGLADRQRETYA